MGKIKLSTYCSNNSISYITGYRWFKTGKLPGAIQTTSGMILVEDDSKDDITSDAMTMFLKKTIEFSSNNSSIEEFAAFILSNFNLKLNNSEVKQSKSPVKKDGEIKSIFDKDKRKLNILIVPTQGPIANILDEEDKAFDPDLIEEIKEINQKVTDTSKIVKNTIMENNTEKSNSVRFKVKYKEEAK